MTQQSHTPEDVAIVLRNREHDIAESLSHDWFDNHAFKTAWFNAMSITFPAGEKFFIDSVRHYADRIEDPKLAREIRHFCGQEGFHRREHERYNEALCSATWKVASSKTSSEPSPFFHRYSNWPPPRHWNISPRSWLNRPCAKTTPCATTWTRQ